MSEVKGKGIVDIISSPAKCVIWAGIVCAILYPDKFGFWLGHAVYSFKTSMHQCWEPPGYGR